MDRGSQRRAFAALIHHAKEAFDDSTKDTALVAPISPSPPALIERVLRNLDLKSDDVVLDLGCGDGRWLIAAARMVGCACRGFDLNEALLEKARGKATESRVALLVTLEFRDIFEVSLAGCTVIIIYLFREGLARLKAKLEEEAAPGARIISVGFKIRGWVPTSSVPEGGMRAYLYRVAE